MTSPLRRPAGEARQRILLKAHELFYRDGIRATGIDRVIAEAEVTKVTFYRHFPSKGDLILAFLDYRHEHWMAWLKTALARELEAGRHGSDAVLDAFAGWWGDAQYRGCAFINAAVELGSTDPAVLEIARRHKQDMADALAPLFAQEGQHASPVQTEVPAPSRAQALALALDGAIVRIQMGEPMPQVLQTLRQLIAPLFSPGPSRDREALPTGSA